MLVCIVRGRGWLHDYQIRRATRVDAALLLNIIFFFISLSLSWDFTYFYQELCKLEIVRQDKKSDWYEVRSSMRLVWLKNKQEIVPVEVICSFQPIHMDGPAGSANSIVARLQRVSALL